MLVAPDEPQEIEFAEHLFFEVLEGLGGERLGRGERVGDKRLVDGDFPLKVAQKLVADVRFVVFDDEARDEGLVFVDAVHGDFVEVYHKTFLFQYGLDGFDVFVLEALFARKSHIVNIARVMPPFFAGKGFQLQIGGPKYQIGYNGRCGRTLRQVVFVREELGKMLGQSIGEPERRSDEHLKYPLASYVWEKVLQIEIEQPFFAHVLHGIGVDGAHQGLVGRADNAPVGAIGANGVIYGLQPLLQMFLDLPERLVRRFDQTLLPVWFGQVELEIFGFVGAFPQLRQGDVQVLGQSLHGLHFQEPLRLLAELVGRRFFLGDNRKMRKKIRVHGRNG